MGPVYTLNSEVPIRLLPVASGLVTAVIGAFVSGSLLYSGSNDMTTLLAGFILMAGASRLTFVFDYLNTFYGSS